MLLLYIEAFNRPAFSSASISPCNMVLSLCILLLWPLPMIFPLWTNTDPIGIPPSCNPISASSIAAAKNLSNVITPCAKTIESFIFYRTIISLIRKRCGIWFSVRITHHRFSCTRRGNPCNVSQVLFLGRCITKSYAERQNTISLNEFQIRLPDCERPPVHGWRSWRTPIGSVPWDGQIPYSCFHITECQELITASLGLKLIGAWAEEGRFSGEKRGGVTFKLWAPCINFNLFTSQFWGF